jgi:uncharacterized protein HemX
MKMTEHNPVQVAYTPPAPQVPRKSRAAVITIIVMVLALIGLAVALTMQYRATQDAVDAQNEYKAALADTEIQVTDALEDVEHFKNLVNDQNNQLASCTAVVEISDHEYEQVVLALKLGSDYIGDKYTAASIKLDEIDDHTEDISDIVRAAGHDNINDLWDECSPDYTPL